MEKLKKLREQFSRLGIDGMLITNGQNRRYMTNFTGSYGVVLLSHAQAKLITDFRYVNQAKEQAQDYEIVQLPHKESVFAEVADQVQKMGITKLGFEQENLTFSLFGNYQAKLYAELIPLTGVIEAFRMIKSEAEIAIIRTAAEIADAAFNHILGVIRPGISELEVANELEFFMRKQGAASSAFDTIVASGYRGALPHGVASSKKIERGEMVTLDFGAYYQGYRSDITRTVAVGEPNERCKEIHSIVQEALLRGIGGIKPGITGKQADAMPREYITERGYGENFGHGTGHGVGLDIHEEPFMSARCEIVLQPGMVLTVEPGIYLPDLGGVRIEDDILLAAEGNELLTHSSRDLIIL